MKKVLILALVSILLLVSFVSATTTEINVKTIKDHPTYLIVQDSISHSLITSKVIDSGSEGKITASLDSGSQSKVDILVNVKEDSNGEKVLIATYRYEEHKNGEPVYLCLDVDDTDDDCEDAFAVVEELAVNETANETAAVEELASETEASSSALTGFASAVKDKLFSKTSYYILGAIAVVIVGFFLVRKGIPYMKNRQASQEFYTPQKSERAEKAQIGSGRIFEVERKLQAAQAELNRLKNQERISFVEKKLQKDKEELERMKRGE